MSTLSERRFPAHLELYPTIPAAEYFRLRPVTLAASHTNDRADPALGVDVRQETSSFLGRLEKNNRVIIALN